MMAPVSFPPKKVEEVGHPRLEALLEGLQHSAA
jgi:hypothetical protein